MITEDQKNKITELVSSELGKKYPKAYKCYDFVRDIYEKVEVEVGISINLFDWEMPVFEEIWLPDSAGRILYLHRKTARDDRKITHIGIILPDHKLFHYSRWIGGEGFYKVVCSSFSEVFEVYDFVPPFQSSAQGPSI